MQTNSRLFAFVFACRLFANSKFARKFETRKRKQTLIKTRNRLLCFRVCLRARRELIAQRKAQIKRAFLRLLRIGAAINQSCIGGKLSALLQQIKPNKCEFAKMKCEIDSLSLLRCAFLSRSKFEISCLENQSTNKRRNFLAMRASIEKLRPQKPQKRRETRNFAAPFSEARISNPICIFEASSRAFAESRASEQRKSRLR